MFNRNITAFLIISLVVTSPFLTSAQKPLMIGDSILNEVTVKGFSNGESITKQAASISVLNPKQLAELSPNNPVMAWSSLPGVTLEQRAIGSYRINIRGSSLRSPFGVRDVKVYWNGIPFTEANGSTALNLLSMSQMQSVEVIKGPAGSLYGAGLGGVIHLGNFPMQNQSPLKIGLTVGSYNQRQLSAEGTLALVGGKTFYSINQQQVDGYRDHNALDRQVYQLSHQIQFNEDNQLTLHGLVADLNYEIPGGLTREQFEANPQQARAGSASQNASIDQLTAIFGADYVGFINPTLSHSTQLGITYTDFENPFNLDYKIDENRELALRHQWTYTPESQVVDWRFDAGFEWQYANNDAANYGNVAAKADTVRFKDELTINRATFFLQSKLGYKKWSASLGVSSNLLTYNVNRTENAFADTFNFERDFSNQLIPRFSIQYSWRPEQMTYFSVSEGFSSPTLDEVRTNEGSINEDLEAERGTTYELGHKIYRNKLQLDATLFYSSLRESITTYTNADGVVLFRNAGETDQKGVEVGANYIALNQKKGVLNQLTFRTSYQYYDFTFKAYSKRENDFSGNQLTGVPTHTLNEIIHIELFNVLALNVHYRYVSETPLTDNNEVYAAPYHLLNLNANYTFFINQSALKLSAGVENLTDITYSLGNDL
ncbi:MAG: iron complex outermembrane receptor protein, partial [Marivirga sp.]